MTTEQQARELLAQECEVMGGEETARILRVGRSDFVTCCAIQAIGKLITQAANDKRIADAVRGGMGDAMTVETQIGQTLVMRATEGMHLKGQRVYIIPASVLEGE